MARSQSLASGKPKLASYSDGPQIRDFLRSQAFGTIKPVSASDVSSSGVKNRTIIITGANSGLGLEATKQLAQLDCNSRLILACRNISKGNTAREAVIASLSHARKGQVDIHVWQLDMASRASLTAFAERANTELDRVDALILNAGVDLVMYEKASDHDGGFEMTLMVNVVATILLASLMVPVLRMKRANTDPVPRITIVGSAVQFFPKYDILLQAEHEEKGEGILKWLSNEERWKNQITQERYYLSKGILQMLVQRLAEKITQNASADAKDIVVVNCVAPGYCRTELFREAETSMSKIALKLIGRDGHVGARALVVGAVGIEGDERSHGGYMSEGQVKKSCAWFATSQGQDISRTLWAEMLQILEETRPGTTKQL